MSAQPSDDDNVRPLQHKPTAAYVHVTPAMAERWLRSNTINRVTRAAKVGQYARDMAAGRWTISNDDLCFDVDGKLLNGQHRLKAIMKSGETVLLGIKRNVPLDAMPNMDSGIRRTAADALRFDQVTNAGLVASTVRLAILIDTGRIYQDSKTQVASHGEILDYFYANPEIADSVRAAVRVRPAIDAPPTAIATVHRMIADVESQALADYFIDQAASRTSEPEGSAVHAIDRRLREVRRNRQKYETRNYVYLLLRAWTYYAAGKPVTRLQMAPRANALFRLPAVARWQRTNRRDS